MSLRDYRPPSTVRTDTEGFRRVGSLAELRRGQSFISIAEPLDTPAPLPLLNETLLEAAVVAQHDAWSAAPAINLYALDGGVLGGGGILVKDGYVWLPSDCFPAYLALGCERTNFPRLWLGALTEDRPKTLSLDTPCACPLHPNIIYGHFLLEMLPRIYLLWMARQMGLGFTLIADKNCPAFIKSFLLCCFGEADVRWYDGRTEVVHAPIFYVPSMMHCDYNFHPLMNVAVEDLAMRMGAMGARQADTSFGPRLYLSRTKRGASWHKMRNETEVEDVFRRHGFSIVHPQEMALPDQMRMYAQAECLAGEYSSALHNVLFAPRGTTVVALNMINYYQSRIARLRENPLALLPPSDGVMRDWRLQVPDWRSRPEAVIWFDIECHALEELIASGIDA